MLVHQRQVEDVLGRVDVDPAAFGMVVNLRPDVIARRINVTRVVAEAAAEECEAVGELAAPAGSADEQLLDVVVARKLRGGLAVVLAA